MRVERSLRSYIVGVVALGVGLLFGKLLGSFTFFIGTLIVGSVVHLTIIVYDVCHHLSVGIMLPAWKWLSGLLLAAIAYFLFVLMEWNIFAIAIMAIACALYLVLMVRLNAQLMPSGSLEGAKN
jgi:hypothetical protein